MLLNYVWDLLFPVICQGCGDEGAYLCLSCQGGLEPATVRCLACNRDSLLGRVHPACQTPAWALDGLLVSTSYQSHAVSSLIWFLKYNGVRDVAESLGTLMVDYLIQSDLLDYFSGAHIVSVPLHKKRQRKRGYNQAELLAQVVARRLTLMYRPIVERTRNTNTQVELKRENRFANVSGAFSAAAHPVIGGSRILLIDDVVTTGATLNECAKVLKAHGAAEVWGLVVARN